MDRVITEREYSVHYYEIDMKKRCLITSIMNYFQDIALIQSEDQGIGIDYLLKEKSLAWVLYKWDIKVDRYPLYKEKVKVRTWAYSLVKFYAYRKFEVIDENGEVIITADTIWLLVNINTKKPVRIIKEVFDGYGVELDCTDKLDMGKIQAPSKIDSQIEFIVRYSDIDTNRHVNNVKYADWCIETVPLDIVLNYTLKRTRIIYKKETKYGEKIKVLTEILHEQDKIICLHKIVDKDDKELCSAETTWEE